MKITLAFAQLPNAWPVKILDIVIKTDETIAVPQKPEAPSTSTLHYYLLGSVIALVMILIGFMLRRSR